MNSIGTQNINTERLLLRRINIDDTETMFQNWASDPDVTKYMRWKTHKDIETTKGVINSWIKEYENTNTYHWGIVYKEKDKLIGTIAVTSINKDAQSGSVGYCIAKKYWNKGITTEALKAVLNYMFFKADFKKITASHIVENLASGKVMQKSGMKFKGIKKDGDKDCEGNLRNIAMYEIDRTE